MDWLLALLALFNVLSMITVFTPRAVPREAAPWAVFITALIATELAWVWLPLQIVLAGILALGGALDSRLGDVAMVVLAFSWLGLAWCLWMSARARPVLEDALRTGLGTDYLASIPDVVQRTFRHEVTFSDWSRPFGFARSDVEVISHIPYAPAGVRQHLDVYRPLVIPEDGCPVLFQIHGGAWMIGDKAHQALPLMYELASRGWICVAANYRLSPSIGFPVHLEDCKRALCWIRENGADYGMDTDFVAVTGGSAGGHLSALVGLTGNRVELQQESPGTDTSVQACIPFYGVYDFLVRYGQHPNELVYRKFLTGKVMHDSYEDNPDLWELACPIAQIHEDAPPFMILHGTHDSLSVVKEARVFSDKLREVSKNAVVYAEMPGAEHAWEVVHSPRTAHTVDAVHRFLEWARAALRSVPAGSG